MISPTPDPLVLWERRSTALELKPLYVTGCHLPSDARFHAYPAEKDPAEVLRQIEAVLDDRGVARTSAPAKDLATDRDTCPPYEALSVVDRVKMLATAEELSLDELVEANIRGDSMVALLEFLLDGKGWRVLREAARQVRRRGEGRIAYFLSVEGADALAKWAKEREEELERRSGKEQPT